MTWWDWFRELIPHLMALAFWFTSLSLAVFERRAGTANAAARTANTGSRNPKRLVFWVAMTLAFIVWVFVTIVKMQDLSEKAHFADRRRNVADAIGREIRDGAELLDRIAHDQRYQHRNTCENQALVDWYAPKIEDWKRRVQVLLDETLPGSGARTRFETVAASFPKSDCPKMDFNYWRLLAFVQNLHAIWEAVDQYCGRVGPTCRRTASGSSPSVSDTPFAFDESPRQEPRRVSSTNYESADLPSIPSAADAVSCS